MAVAAIQGADQHIRRSLGFSILLKDTSTCRLGESNRQPLDNNTLALPLSHKSTSIQCYRYMYMHQDSMVQLFWTHMHQTIFQVQPNNILKVPYYDKYVFSGLYIYKVVFAEPANSQNEENKRFLHGLCSPPTGKMVLLQAVQIQLLSLCKERSHLHWPTSSAW